MSCGPYFTIGHPTALTPHPGRSTQDRAVGQQELMD